MFRVGTFWEYFTVSFAQWRSSALPCVGLWGKHTDSAHKNVDWFHRDERRRWWGPETRTRAAEDVGFFTKGVPIIMTTVLPPPDGLRSAFTVDSSCTSAWLRPHWKCDAATLFLPQDGDGGREAERQREGVPTRTWREAGVHRTRWVDLSPLLYRAAVWNGDW